MRKQTVQTQIAMPSDLKRLNRQKILEVFRGGEVLTAADIHEATHISRPTVMRALQYFCQCGVLKSVGLGSATSVGGKKPEQFAFGDDRKILSISLWPQSITFTLCGLVGSIGKLTHYEHELENDLDEAFASLAGYVQQYFQDEQITSDDLYGVVLNVPGTVDYDRLLLRYNTKAPGWGTEIPMEKYLRPIFGDDVVLYVDNAGKAVGRAVLLDNPEYSERRLLTVFSTWGISACMIERGHVLNGRDSLIGEIGHAVISDSAETVCTCGKHGCLESMVSIRHIRRMLAEDGDETLGTGENVTFQMLFDASEKGNPKARKIVAYLAHCFATVLHNLALTYNQDMIIFQGDFAYADSYFDDCLKEELQQFRYFPDDSSMTILYDKRQLTELAARGDSALMQRNYFASFGEVE